MAELNIRFDIRISPSTLRWFLVALCLCLMVRDVGSESVTLNTYYPAPSGVYQYMITTNQTFLARDGGSVNVGYTTPQAAKLSVNGTVGIGLASGGTTKSQLDVAGNVSIGTYAGSSAAPTNGLAMSGSLGIGTAGPQMNAEMVGTQGSLTLGANGWFTGAVGMADPGTSNGTIAADNSAYKALMIVGNNIAGNSGLGREVKVWDFLNVQGQFATTGKAGIGTISPFSELDVAGGDQVLTVRQTGCSEVGYTLGSTSVCPANNYATLTEGIMVQKTALGNMNGIDTGSGSQVWVYNGSMYCCPCPTGTCNVPGW